MKRLNGVNTLLMTPFTESNEIDVDGIFRQIDRVLDAERPVSSFRARSVSTTPTPCTSAWKPRRPSWST